MKKFLVAFLSLGFVVASSFSAFAETPRIWVASSEYGVGEVVVYCADFKVDQVDKPVIVNEENIPVPDALIARAKKKAIETKCDITRIVIRHLL